MWNWGCLLFYFLNDMTSLVASHLPRACTPRGYGSAPPRPLERHSTNPKPHKHISKYIYENTHTHNAHTHIHTNINQHTYLGLERLEGAAQRRLDHEAQEHIPRVMAQAREAPGEVGEVLFCLGWGACFVCGGGVTIF